MTTTFDRRSFMGYFAGAGLSSTLFPGVLWAKLAAGAEITVETIASAEEVAGIHFDAAERELDAHVGAGFASREQLDRLALRPAANDGEPFGRLA